MRTAFLIARKDIRLRLRDKSALIYGVIAPLGLAFLFSMIMNPIQNTKFTAEYVVVDYDKGPIAQAFTQVLDGLTKEEGFTVRSVSSYNEAKAEVIRGSDAFGSDDKPKAEAGFMLPPLLSQHVTTGHHAVGEPLREHERRIGLGFVVTAQDVRAGLHLLPCLGESGHSADRERAVLLQSAHDITEGLRDRPTVVVDYDVGGFER